MSSLQVSMCNTTTRPARNEWSLPAYIHDPIVYMHAPSTNKKRSNGSWRLLHPPAPFFLPKPNWLSCILDAFWVYTSDQIKNTTVKSGRKCAMRSKLLNTTNVEKEMPFCNKLLHQWVPPPKNGWHFHLPKSEYVNTCKTFQPLGTP